MPSLLDGPRAASRRTRVWLKQRALSLLLRIAPEISLIQQRGLAWHMIESRLYGSDVHPTAKLYSPYTIGDCRIGRYSYVSQNAMMYGTTVGAFCSVGPNLVSGYGIHPTSGISTSPMFYSPDKQNGMTLCERRGFEEHAPVVIGNDVFVGVNVTILDGVKIGDGAVIGAGAVVREDIPPYAVAVGVPARVVRYRFAPEVVERLRAIQWWEFGDDRLEEIAQSLWDVEGFISAHSDTAGDSQ